MKIPTTYPLMSRTGDPLAPWCSAGLNTIIGVVTRRPLRIALLMRFVTRPETTVHFRPG